MLNTSVLSLFVMGLNAQPRQSEKPRMGWSAREWDCEDTSYKNIMVVAQEFESKGLVDKGYDTIVLNECWMKDERDT